MHLLTIIGLLFNCGLICINRFVKQLPSWLYIGGQVLAIIAMAAGIALTAAKR